MSTYAADLRSVGYVASVERLCRWWNDAPQAERFALLRATIHGDPNSPPLKTLQVAIYLAEVAAGEVSEG